MIELFQQSAKDYHTKLNSPLSDGETQKKREDTLAASRRALTLQQTEVVAAASIAYQLAAYQAENRGHAKESEKEENDRLARMENELHHPTDKLQCYMLAAGKIAPDQNCSPHHIVQGVGKRIKNKLTGEYTQTTEAIQARLILHLAGIGINDPDNGVWLPASLDHVPHWFMPKALPHRNIHTYEYEEFVLRGLKGRTNENQVRAALSVIASQLTDGTAANILTNRSLARYNGKTKSL